MNKVKIQIPYAYGEQTIPPRCRKPRQVGRKAVATVTIKDVTPGEAPVAIVQPGYDRQGTPFARTYRWFGGRLYAPYRRQAVSRGPWRGQTLKQFHAKPIRERGSLWNKHGEIRRDILRWARSILFVDGERWEVAGEPRYVIMTFGLGCNHGLGWGTSLCTDNGYNSNIGRDRYYRIDEFDRAVVAATAIATGRGDTKALPIPGQDPTRFQILIPEAVKLCPAKEHGTGDPFINRVEGLVTAAKNPVIAGLVGLSLALQG